MGGVDRVRAGLRGRGEGRAALTAAGGRAPGGRALRLLAADGRPSAPARAPSRERPAPRCRPLPPRPRGGASPWIQVSSLPLLLLSRLGLRGLCCAVCPPLPSLVPLRAGCTCCILCLPRRESTSCRGLVQVTPGVSPSAVATLGDALAGEEGGDLELDSGWEAASKVLAGGQVRSAWRFRLEVKV